ncbi:MAG: protein translocase SEC61 complex subunit gamma [Thermoproteota archaeon]|jgi:protein translocase SEC61 complex gamma subunit|nr:protein translocase SEC61 complex subunit gamma [Thermoproteota archaeon]
MSERIREAIRAVRNIFNLASKPTRDEFRLMMKITLLGIFVVGIYAFLINIVAIGLQSLHGIPGIPQIALLVITIVIGITLVIYYYGSRKGKW